MGLEDGEYVRPEIPNQSMVIYPGQSWEDDGYIVWYRKYRSEYSSLT